MPRTLDDATEKVPIPMPLGAALALKDWADAQDDVVAAKWYHN